MRLCRLQRFLRSFQADTIRRSQNVFLLASYDSTVFVTIVQLVSPLVKYSLLVSTTRVTLQLVNVMQHTLNKHSEIKKNFFIALHEF